MKAMTKDKIIAKQDTEKQCEKMLKYFQPIDQLRNMKNTVLFLAKKIDQLESELAALKQESYKNEINPFRCDYHNGMQCRHEKFKGARCCDKAPSNCPLKQESEGEDKTELHPCDIEQVMEAGEKNCSNCKFRDIKVYEEPCASCSIRLESKDNWQPKDYISDFDLKDIDKSREERH